jgi:hypothetical protein
MTAAAGDMSLVVDVASAGSKSIILVRKNDR